MYRAFAGILVACVVLSPIRPGFAADPTYLKVDGEVPNVLSLSKADFDGFARTEVETIDSAGRTSTYEGVDLASILLRAGVPLKDDLKGADVAKFLHVEGSDGFAAVVSLPEFDKSTFLIADRLDGALLAPDNGPLQMVSPGETRRSRWVKHVDLLRIIRTHR